ncbi:MAG: dihydroorotate dehydrogenase electron transfer subunit [Thermoprotei archaeon]|nr:MAG: dihydroorotate dehydrogenase electron transfer subunit [Thermoprotei archaeon]RLG76209.1 MAG: dihydroorotate dehydrogenase electron transfer subunit [Thermoprotei archaeon]
MELMLRNMVVFLKMFLETLKMCKAEIVEDVEEAEGIKSLLLETSIKKPVPGQFVMVWVPGFEEIPISPSMYERNVLRLTVAAVGETTRKIHSLKPGERLFIRGPYGRGFNLDEKGNFLLVAGGYGAAPIIYALHELRKKGKNVAYVIGARSKDKLLFVGEAKKFNAEVYIATDDGSLGFKGSAVEVAEKLIAKYDNVLACGPERMLYKIMLKCLELGVKCQISIERYIKCGIGICGSCVLDPKGLRVCSEGPVFYAEELANTEFGKYYTYPPGIKKPTE